jgi:hypothetical protein
MPSVDLSALTGDPVYTWSRKLEIFLRGRPTDLMLCWASTLLIRLNMGPALGKKVTELGLLFSLLIFG